jgi:hypothetical protein
MNLPLSKEVMEVMQMVSRIGSGTVAFHQPPRSKKIKLYSNEAVIAFAQILLAESDNPSDRKALHEMLEQLRPDLPIEVEFTNEQKPH